MKINGRDVTLTSEELDLLKRLKDNGVMSIIKSDEDAFMWHDGDFSTQGNMINVRWFKGFDWMQKGEMLVVGKLIDESEKPKTVWELEEGDVYCLIDSRGSVFIDGWDNVSFDVDCRDQGNVFLTKEEAEFEAKRREVYAKVKKYARPFQYNEDNFYAYWTQPEPSIRIGHVTVVQRAELYFESEEQIKQAITEVGKDDFKKYYLGVTE